MNNPTPTSNTNTEDAPSSPGKYLTGALISGSLAFALYSLTMAIAQSFAAKPIHSNNQLVVNLAAAVRTLVVGVSALGTGVFGLVTLGLVGLTVQVLLGGKKRAGGAGGEKRAGGAGGAGGAEGEE